MHSLKGFSASSSQTLQAEGTTHTIVTSDNYVTAQGEAGAHGRCRSSRARSGRAERPQSRAKGDTRKGVTCKGSAWQGGGRTWQRVKAGQVACPEDTAAAEHGGGVPAQQARRPPREGIDASSLSSIILAAKGLLRAIMNFDAAALGPPDQSPPLTSHGKYCTPRQISSTSFV